MPSNLLPTVVTSLRTRIEEGFRFKSDQTSLLVSFAYVLIVQSAVVPLGAVI